VWLPLKTYEYSIQFNSFIEYDHQGNQIDGSILIFSLCRRFMKGGCSVERLALLLLEDKFKVVDTSLVLVMGGEKMQWIKPGFEHGPPGSPFGCSIPA
jgi:hypothetical protein